MKLNLLANGTKKSFTTHSGNEWRDLPLLEKKRYVTHKIRWLGFHQFFWKLNGCFRGEYTSQVTEYHPIFGRKWRFSHRDRGFLSTPYPLAHHDTKLIYIGFFSSLFWAWKSGLLSRKLCISWCFSKGHRFFFVAFLKEKKAFVFSYASELFSSRTLCSLFLFLSRLVCRFKKFIAFLSSLATI